jgi:hypothetical protein
MELDCNNGTCRGTLTGVNLAGTSVVGKDDKGEFFSSLTMVSRKDNFK